MITGKVMFPFTVKGKVSLGLRKDYHLSTASLEERIAERLMEPARLAEQRRERDPSSHERWTLTGGVSRLMSLGLLSAVKVKRINVFFIDESLFASYEMDATVTTLISIVLVPMILGTALIAHSRLSLLHVLIILFLLVLTSWGVDIWVLVQLVRHEIRQTASEIRGVLLLRDIPFVDAHHRDLYPEDLLATAYYYQRNGLTKRSRAYFTHLVGLHPETLEAELAGEHLAEDPGSIPGQPVGVGPGGGKHEESQRGDGREKKGLFGFFGRFTREERTARKHQERWIHGPHPQRGKGRTDEGKGNRKLWSLPRFRAKEDLPDRKRGDRWSQDTARERAREKAGRLRRRWKLLRRKSREERMEDKRKKQWSRGSSQQDMRQKAGILKRRWRLLRRKSREERLARKREERWLREHPGSVLKNSSSERKGMFGMFRRKTDSDRPSRVRGERGDQELRTKGSSG